MLFEVSLVKRGLSFKIKNKKLIFLENKNSYDFLSGDEIDLEGRENEIDFLNKLTIIEINKLKEKGFVSIKNQKATILGNVCMDMLMVDVTNITCEERDEVIIFGETPHVTEIATICQTIPYEILTSISQRVKRIFYKN